MIWRGFFCPWSFSNFFVQLFSKKACQILIVQFYFLRNAFLEAVEQKFITRTPGPRIFFPLSIFIRALLSSSGASFCSIGNDNANRYH